MVQVGCHCTAWLRWDVGHLSHVIGRKAVFSADVEQMNRRHDDLDAFTKGHGLGGMCTAAVEQPQEDLDAEEQFQRRACTCSQVQLVVSSSHLSR